MVQKQAPAMLTVTQDGATTTLGQRGVAATLVGVTLVTKGGAQETARPGDPARIDRRQLHRPEGAGTPGSSKQEEPDLGAVPDQGNVQFATKLVTRVEPVQ